MTINELCSVLLGDVKVHQLIKRGENYECLYIGDSGYIPEQYCDRPIAFIVGEKDCVITIVLEPENAGTEETNKLGEN